MELLFSLVHTHVWFGHRCNDKLVSGFLPNGLWTIEIKEPLTVTPSIQCNNCGLHGWIRQGEWVSI